MPGVTGTDLPEWLEKNNPALARRTVFMTGEAFTPRARRFLQRSPSLTLEKPVEARKLLEIVRSLVAERRGARE